MADVAILIPVLNRPQNVTPLIESIEANTPEQHRTLFIASSDQGAELDALEQAGADHMVLPPVERGDYARKIQAGFAATDEPYVFTGADDIRFHPGWFPAAERLMSDAIGVVGTNDLGSPRVMAGDHATHFLVARWYVDQHGTIDQPGQVFHPGYWHEYVDDELVGTAKSRHAWASAHDSHVEHMHPDWGKVERDRSYQRTGQRKAIGHYLFEQREHLWT